MRLLVSTVVGALVLLIGIAVGGPNRYEMYSMGDRNVYTLTPLNTTKAGGTGFTMKYGPYHFSISNKHVCDSDSFKRANAISHTELLPVIAISEHYDLCMLKALYKAPGLPLASSLTLREHIFVLGHPGLRPLTLTEGEYLGNEDIYILNVKNSLEAMFCMFAPTESCFKKYTSGYTQTRIYAGNSGSPVLNESGEVVGVVFAGSNDNAAGYFVLRDQLETWLIEVLAKATPEQKMLLKQ